MLGPFLSDNNIPPIQFVYQNQPVTITRNIHNGPTLAPLAQFNHFIFPTITMAAYSPLPNPETVPIELPTQSLNLVVAKLLQQFGPIFAPPQGLPPHRLQNHHIHLLSNSQPVNVKPYRYLFCQKETMTKMIQEMLTEGIIRPSRILFPSSVLIVRKKDGS